MEVHRILCRGADRVLHAHEEKQYANAQITCCDAQVFACTVGQKPSKAPFYVNDTAEVLSILGRLVAPVPTSPRS